MNSSSDSSVSYLCPRCQAKLTAHVEDAGQRRECPQCGKLVKVPGTSRAVPRHRAGPVRPGESDAASAPGRGIANLPVICPLCGTRMYATRQQMGQTMVCPDCLESVVVPDQAPPQRKPKVSSIPSSTLSPSPPPVSASPASSAKGHRTRETTTICD